ncbi:lipopolysaccharide kinase InaA family protein [Endozoicomonas sp. Mp262]|uniref:lipopolysaccharide kinase InaA family protein n=1 Tax=Endozoicomonas sp. Mp262 TaxID=2919499 RepID=UPI0021D844DE
MAHWNVTEPWQGTAIATVFGSLDRVFQLSGKTITKDALSEVILFEAADTRFYVKRYTAAGKGLRKYLGKSRIRAEWENMLFFHQLGLPAAKVVAYGEERRGGLFVRGALITEELKATTDMARLAHQHDARLKDPKWLYPVLQQIAEIAKTLHRARFIHTDFKWRNILVTGDSHPQVYLIDCPAGYQWPQRCCGKPVARGIIKDLACLDKVAKYHLSPSQRLRFYKWYCFGNVKQKLSVAQKQQIRRIVAFFEGRE